MTDFDELMRIVERQGREILELRTRHSNMLREGTVQKADGKKGYKVTFGLDENGKPIPSTWFPHPEQGGAFKSWRPSTEGQIVYVASLGGDQRTAFMIPKGGFSDNNKQPSEKLDENVDTYGQYRREVREKDTLDKVGKAKVTKRAEGKITAETGDQPENGGSPGVAGGNLQHELNRQLQGIRANLTQLENNVAGLHEAASKMREIAQFRIPELATIKDILDGKPESLEKSAKMALGNLEGYVAKSMQQMLGKLANGFMANVMGLVQGFVGGQMGGILDQVQQLASAGGLKAAAGQALNAAVGEARGMIADAAGGSTATLADKMSQMAGIVAGSPAEAAFGLLKGQMGGIMGGALDVAAHLGGMVDGQQNLVKGLTRSYRLGGY